jgi:hypothetical protein
MPANRHAFLRRIGSRPQDTPLHAVLSKQCLGAVMLALAALVATAAGAQTVGDDGVVKLRSEYSVEESVARMKQDIAAKGILFFQAVDQARLGAKAGIKIHPSTLIEFGNPLGPVQPRLAGDSLQILFRTITRARASSAPSH